MIHPIIRRTLPAMIALQLLSSTVALTPFSYLASGNMMFPEQPPAGIHITGSGSVEGTDMIQAIGNTYILTGDVAVSISVLRDGVVLDGNGHTLRGSGSGIGVFIQGRNGVTIKNLTIENFAYGIKLTWLSYDTSGGRSVTITGNTFSGNKYAIAFLEHLPGSTISDNHFVGNTYAVYSLSGVVFRGDQFRDNDYCISDDYSFNDVDSSNMMNGKPLYYWVNQQDKAVPSNAGWVTLKHCRNLVPPETKFVAGDANVWENGKEGNYWSDYTTRYPNATEVGKTGVGDTPFYINENNVDNHPLMAPVDISNADIALSTQGDTQNSQAQQHTFPSEIIIALIAAVAIVGAGLAVYFRKFRN